ncbi:2-acylglycerol O-acyltransferase 2-A (Acyl-CoA:monoacylglycerol acyltransferase 2-A) (MGAT2-A) (Monoacylglycerol O-acyltransferase 2-A) [Durusdinium trenchii]|uniref:2-acylglycerol O-acyltransferase 2-A (Acyl-CoA:monoacylglycerol acyltransferase 2-A) (MGAT2-A) (Monoacylglycerol O-acyltransferase 2-A) n=1 Tax=Durusdinium trenchii TaxID=1381693 RepID=A0ABP0HM04_9DINO
MQPISWLLSFTGFHRQDAWHERPVPGSPGIKRRRRTLTSPDDDDGNGDAKEVDKAQKSNSSFEEETAITKVLKSVDPSLLDDSPGGVNALTRKGTILMTMCSCLGFHALRLILRDAFFRSASSTRPNTLLKRKVAEHYLLSAIHAFGCSYFSLRKFLSGRWNSPVGSEAMLCFSLGYTSYTLCALKTQLLSDPLWALNELGNFVKIWSCLRAQGVGWVVPMLFSAEVPTAFLDTLRMLAEFGIQPSHIVWRMFLGAFTLSFVSVKAIALPAILGYFVLRPQDYPELHQPAFLPAKLAILARAFLNYLWLSIVARHWVPTRHFHPEGEYLISRREERLPRLREITPNMGQVIQHIRKAYNPMSLLFFSVLQGCYFVGPAAIPAILYALARRPKYRMAAGSVLAMLGIMAVWPMHMERPYRTASTPMAALLQKWLRERLLRYFSFKAIFEEPLQKDRRYMLAVMPHGVIPFASTCLSIALEKEGFVPNSIGADILFQIPLLRQLCRFGGLVPATPQSIKRALTWPYPNNVTFIVPGGIAEIFLMRPDLEQVFIKSRKGFVRLALQSGVDIVPVYGLGHTQLFTMLDKSSALGGFLMRMSRRFKVSLPLSYGRLGMPLVPYSKPIAALVGKPIRIEKAYSNPPEELVNDIHAQFIAELQRIFEKHKGIVPGYEHKQLYLEDEAVPPLQKDAMATDVLFPSSMPDPKGQVPRSRL